MESMMASKQIPCARAVHSFESQAEHELGFAAGESIMLLRRIDENWLEGKLDSKVGIFPANYVKIELGSPSVSHESDLARSGKPYAIARFPFAGDRPGDLSFGQGDLVELVEVVGSGWLRGRIRDTEGIFPGSFVKVIKETEEDHPLVNGVNGVDGPMEVTKQPHPLLRTTVSAPSVQSEVSPLYEEVGDLHPTPSRSAPAPPNSLPAQKQDKYMTLPKPKPRKALTRHVSMSDNNQKLRNLESDLQIEHKLLESAQNLLRINHSQLKMEKLEITVVTHQNNIDTLTSKINAIRQRESVPQCSPVVPPPLPPPRPAPPTSAQQQQRSKVINELVHTERDFHHQVQLCVDKVIPSLQMVSEINSELLFGNLDEVASLSKDLLSALEEGKPLVGGVFVTFAPRLRDTYGMYCRNHDVAASILEKYMESPVLADKIRHCMDELRDQIQAWDLQSFLIKPVQRILKYPLLVDKLVESTEEKHADRKAIQNARDVIVKMAQDINEIKRRKDIVERYTGPKDERRGTLSKHSIQKKVRRMQQAFTQLTGLRSKTIDTKFDEIESKVLSLETELRTVLKDISTWIEELQHICDSRECSKDGMTLYNSDVSSLTNYETILTELRQALKSHSQYVKDFVMAPLDSLLSLFPDPLHLIHKRKDKLLDYDHTQYAYEHAEEPDKIKQLREQSLLAKRNYEALNQQLLEELPNFLDISVNMLQHQLTVLVQAQYLFHTDVSKLLYPFCEVIEGSTEIHTKHATEIAYISHKLTQLSLVPASLAMNFTTKTNVPKRSSEGSLSEGSSPMSPLDHPLMVSSPPSEGVFSLEENLAEEGEEDEDLPEGSELEVLYDFDAQDSAELSLTRGEVVVLRCPHDRIGCEEWWLVESGVGHRGYVPATYLEKRTPNII
ncbi:dynamin-binding protein-like isoform X2 [Halichondria panicea]|uniref:dynamin-binding protein-like isoform X2 n=1 Tax=Halichondria panicea TaxID=6063 RepID=UPI00312B8C55